ncbi:MAG: aa3-type cytochrome c oxidase subunit IV [Caulobacteraceae bacterium]|nr:aa3-type cytochrome c oxidase subunit IV [Caulobacteraceae bacterium]
METLTHVDEPLLAPAAVQAMHAQTYHRFMLGVKWFAIHLAALGVFLVLWFATPAGFVWGVLAGLIVAGAGAYAMTHGLGHSSEGGGLA